MEPARSASKCPGGDCSFVRGVGSVGHSLALRAGSRFEVSQFSILNSQFYWLLISSVLLLASRSPGQVLNETLQGSTTGARSGGTFVAGGWRVDNEYDCIYWHVPTLSHGAYEFNLI